MDAAVTPVESVANSDEANFVDASADGPRYADGISELNVTLLAPNVVPMKCSKVLP